MHLEPVVGEGAGALPHQLRLQARGQAEQAERLIQQVGAEVEPESTAGECRFAPARAYLGTKALDARFQAGQLTQGATGEYRLQPEKITVPAAILEHRQQPAGLFGFSGQLPGFGEGNGKGLVDHHVLAGGQGGAGERRMGLVG